jgi:hypothetical protein
VCVCVSCACVCVSCVSCVSCQPLGSEAEDSYLTNTRNVSVVTDSLATVRRQLYELLKGTQLNVIPFIPSLFIHIGTCQEYLGSPPLRSSLFALCFALRSSPPTCHPSDPRRLTL